MKLILLVLFAIVSCITATTYSDSASFQSALASGYFSDDFEGDTQGSEFTTYSVGGHPVGTVSKYSESRPSHFYVCKDCGNQFLQTYDDSTFDYINLDLTQIGETITAVGFNVWSSDDNCANSAGNSLTITVDGTTTALTSTDRTQFFGVTNTAGILSIQISGSTSGLYFLSIDNLIIGEVHCGDGVNDNSEDCDGGAGCSATCTCNTNYYVQDPPSTDCDYCLDSDTCTGHGTCTVGSSTKRIMVSSGSVHCACDTGYAGANCDSCDTGYVGYPTCVPHCGDLIVEAAYSEECDGGTNCDTSCNCVTNTIPVGDGSCTYCGNLAVDSGEECDGGANCDSSCNCDTNTVPVGDGSCTYCGNSAVDFLAGEECDGGTGCTACSCDTNYYPEFPPTAGCDYCLDSVTCSGHGTCDFPFPFKRASSTFPGPTIAVSCACDTGYAGANCDSCDTGYVGYPTCVPHCGDGILETSYGEECDGSSSCTIGCTCSSNTANCDNNDANGCEQLLTDAENCGTCSHSCSSLPHVKTYSCVNGNCHILTCKPGFADCNAIDSDGCEIDLSDPHTCGTCSNNCFNKGHVSSASCSKGVCSVITCDKSGGNWVDCNSRGFDGCEINSDVNINNCGACGSLCDLANANSSVCKAGICTLYSCIANHQSCDNVDSNGCEVDLNSPSTCGTCTNDCSKKPNVASATCSNQVCTITSCTGVYGDCDHLAFNGCEINRSVNVNNCGVCGHACNLANAVSQCVSGKCSIKSCNKGFCDKDGKGFNGCEHTIKNGVC